MLKTGAVVQAFRSRTKNGFSLIELSIGLAILGLVIAPLLMQYNIYVTRVNLQTTNGNLSAIANAINNLYIPQNGSYPIPARFDLGPGDPGYGDEGLPLPYDLAQLNALPKCNQPNWYVTAGICKTSNDEDKAVLIGSVPFNALHMREQDSLDAWKNRITYAVALKQTLPASYNPSGLPGGSDRGIRVWANYKASVGAAPSLQPMGTQIAPTSAVEYDMILVSHGERGSGAYSRSGILVAPCPSVGGGLERENCNFDQNFYRNKIHDFSADQQGTPTLFSLVAGSEYFDDVVLDQRAVPQTAWGVHLTSPTVSNVLADRIGVGTQTPLARLHVEGDLKADDVQSDNICACEGACASATALNPTTLCFDPEIIAGTVASMDCNMNAVPGAEPVLGLELAQVNCGSPVDPGGAPVLAGATTYTFPSAYFTWTPCPTGELMTGLVNGVRQCAAP